MDGDWKDKYPRKMKPAYSELLDYFPEDIRALFLRFDQEMRGRFDVRNKYQRFLDTAGWAYGYGRSYSCELLVVTIGHDCFNVLGVSVKDGDSLQVALEKAEEAYNDGFEERYADICAKRRADQIERTKRRVEREKLQMEQITANADPEKLNKFDWGKKASRNDIVRLYQGEARGMVDEELLDEVGYTFYMRCTQAKQARDLMEQGRILCLHCGAVLDAECIRVGGYTPFSKNNLPVNCGCGYSYTYREYRRSCNAANMPGGRAAPIFERFAKKWPGCRDAAQKMLLIDWLIHECHVSLMSGEKGRSVCVNLIEGTKTQIADLILKLAYGGTKNETRRGA